MNELNLAILHDQGSERSSDADLDRWATVGDRARVWAGDIDAIAPCASEDPVSVCLPIDAPRGAFEVAVAGLVQSHRHAVVVPTTLDGSPPEWWVLDLLVRAGATVAVDLRVVRWHDATGLWWTTDDGPLRMPLRITDPGRAKATAQVVVAARGLRPGSNDWVQLVEVSDGAMTLTEPQWDSLLSRQYVRMARRRARKALDPGR